MTLRLFRLACLLVIATGSSSAAPQETATYWNQFRGPRGDGTSVASELPVEFDESRNVRWKILTPGSGWSSPVIWENDIWLTTGSDEKKELRAVCVEMETGKIIKNIKVFDMIERKVDPAYRFDSPHLNSPATPTSVVEADRVFVSFGSQGIACLDRETGDKVWQRRDLRIYQPVRQGSSPIVDEKHLYVAFDGNDRQFFVALDRKTAETRWKSDRNVGTEPIGRRGGKPGDNKKSFATATLVEVDGQRQLIAPAAEATISYDPDTGRELWRVMHPGGFNVAARPVFAKGLVYVFTSGLTHYLMAIKPDGSGDVTDTHVAWSTTRSTPTIPSPIIVEDLLFMITDKGGIARCLNARTGEEIWRKRLGGDHWASPLYANGKLYFSSKQGDVTVLEASRSEPEILARNRMNAAFIASPAVANSSLILRSTTHLYCVSNGYQRSEEEVAREMKQQSPAIAGRTQKPGKTQESIDWDAAYEKLLKSNPAVNKKVLRGEATKELVIAWLKQRRRAEGRKGKSGGKAARDKDGARGGRVNFYAIVIGRLRSKDIELGEFTFEVDHVSSMYANRWVKDEIVGKTIRVTGVAGQFLDNLLQIKRSQTLQFRSGSYLTDAKTLTFGPKFHVLERTAPFNPEDFGVPPGDFRGFRGELTGKIIEAAGYEVLLQVSDSVPASDSNAARPDSVNGRRVRIVGFYNQHRDFFADLHEGDAIRVSVAHPNPSHDELNVTDVVKRIED